MSRLHKAMVTAIVIAALLPAAATLHPTLARAAPVADRESGTALVPIRPAAHQAPASVREAGGPWRVPVGRLDVATRFDPPALRWLPGHRGVDLGAAPSREVRAVGSGIVVYAGELAGRGVVSIDHPGGLRTTYEPVDPLVAAGDSVAAGEAIGRLSPGHASCPRYACLHLGLKRGPAYLDPLLLFGEGRVRLLPRPGAEP